MSLSLDVLTWCDVSLELAGTTGRAGLTENKANGEESRAEGQRSPMASPECAGASL